MRGILAVVWLAVGIYLVVTTLRNRAYVNGLPPTKGNSAIKRQDRLVLLFGVGAIGIGLWHSFRYFIP